MPKSALPPAEPTPDRQARAAAPSRQYAQDGWLRRTLLILLLILVAGIVPVVLMGELLGWWVFSRTPPFIVPRTMTVGALRMGMLHVHPALITFARSIRFCR